MTDPKQAGRTTTLLVLAIIVAAVGVVVLALLGDADLLESPSVLYALPGLALCSLVLPWMKRLPRPGPEPGAPHRDPRWAVLVLAVMLAIASWLGARWINVAFDDDPGDAYPTKVLERSEHKSKNGRSEDYLLVVEPFLPEHGAEPVTHRVSKERYRVTEVGDVVTFRVHPGALGYPWLESV